MALKLPGAEDLGGPVSGRSGRPIASIDTSAIGRGMAQAGQGMRALGVGLKTRESQEKKQVDSATAFDTQSRYLQFEDQQRKAFSQSVLNAPVGADGFTEGQKAEYRKAAKEFFKTVPDDLKPQYNDTLFKFETALTGKADEFAIAEKDRVAKAKVEDGQNVILQGLQDNPDNWREADSQAGALVKNSGRTPIDQDADLRAWRKRRAEALWDIDSKTNGGAARERLGIGGPITPVPAEVQSRANMARDHFVKLGYSPHAAAGIVGNLVQESGVRSDGPSGDSGSAHGMAQWRGARFAKLQRFAAARGKDWRDFNTQLDFIDVELQQDEPAAYARLKASRNVDEATAAFIGFERPQGWSAANPRGGHGWNNRLAAAQRTAGEEVRVSEVAPQYADLSFEDRSKLYDQSVIGEQKAADAAAVQLKAQQAAFKDALALGIEKGDVVSQQDILGANIDDGDKATLLKALNTKLKEEGNASEAMRQFAAGVLSVDPFDDKGRKTVDAVYDRTLANTPADQVQSVTEEMVRQSGVVPKTAMNSLRAGIQSTDQSQVLAALQSAQRLSTVNPAAFGRRDGGGEIQRSVDDFSHYVNDLNMEPTIAAQRIIDGRDPAKQRDRKAIEPAAKEFIKSMQDFDLAGQFDESWGGLSSDPSLGMTPSQELGIKADFLAIAEDQFYQANGDPDLAKSRAVAEMKRTYGVTEFGGVKAVVKHPPERYWPTSTLGVEQSSGRIAGSGGQGPGAELGGLSPFGAGSAEPSLDYARQQLQADIASFAKGPAAPEGKFAGLMEAGNIDLSARPVVQNADGTISTVRSMSFQEDEGGPEILIPTVSPDGKVLSNQDAIKLYRQTGQYLGKFDNADDATAYAEALHEQQAKFYGGGPVIDPSTIQLVTTPETDAMVKRGELPGYAILYKDKSGMYQTIPGKLWRPDVSQAEKINREAQQAETDEAVEFARGQQEIERVKATEQGDDGGRSSSLKSFVDGPEIAPDQKAGASFEPSPDAPAATDNAKGRGNITPGQALSGDDPIFGAR